MASLPDAIQNAFMPGNIGFLGMGWRQSPQKTPHSARASMGLLRQCRNLCARGFFLWRPSEIDRRWRLFRHRDRCARRACNSIEHVFCRSKRLGMRIVGQHQVEHRERTIDTRERFISDQRVACPSGCRFRRCWTDARTAPSTFCRSMKASAGCWPIIPSARLAVWWRRAFARWFV